MNGEGLTRLDLNGLARGKGSGNFLVSGFLSLLFLLLESGRVLFFQEDFDSGRVIFGEEFSRGFFTGIFVFPARVRRQI
jgi:hypothetical protein